MKIKDQPTI